ncbi:hypothetical protein GmRootA79_16370 [Acidovorax sp. A79]|uniref:hypothetical protein n=1 Tax=Acidovorax sp. A79 TaxID=3056107 RepID=UPI0034E8BDD7
MQSHPSPSAHACTPHLPDGARHAGTVLDEAGQPQHRLILLAARPDKRMNWQDAKAWATSVGGDLPSPQEQALLFANCRDALPKAWCWSNKTHEQDASYAWCCAFYDGHQDYGHKSYEGSAVAVRRLPLESFSSSDDTSAHVCTAPAAPSAEVTKAIAALRKRLHRWELEHLRKHAAELADKLELAQERIEGLESEVSRAWDTAESWRMDAMDLVNDLQEAGKEVGLTMGGALVVMEPDDGVPF